MTSDPLAQLIDCQDRLIAALDSRSSDEIAAASMALAGAVATLKKSSAALVGRQDRAGLDHATRQCEAARLRVNILSDWTRQRIGRLAELRSGAPQLVYHRR